MIAAGSDTKCHPEGAAEGSRFFVMPRWLVIAILFSFTVIAVFGFFGMMHGGEHAGCIAVTARASACPGDLAPFAELALHVTTWKGFSGAVVSSPLLLLALVVLSTFIVAARRRERPPPLRLLALDAGYPQRTISILPTFLRWIALHERRDTPSPSPVR